MNIRVVFDAETDEREELDISLVIKTPSTHG